MKNCINTIGLLLGFTFALSSFAQDKIANNQVTASGYHGLIYGQKIDKKALNKAGLPYPSDANTACYYIPISKKQNPKKQLPDPMLLQVINNRLGLIQINDKSVTVFSSNKVGDSVKQVLQNNNGFPTYEVDKYDEGNGNNYHLIYTLPNKNQIKYTMTGGRKMPKNFIETKSWNPTLKRHLTGTVQTISVGVPTAIALVEGCS